MSRYNQASHVFWRCQYHIVWTPKYRFRILKNNIGKEVYRCIYVYCNQLGCEVVELNVQVDQSKTDDADKKQREEKGTGSKTSSLMSEDNKV